MYTSKFKEDKSDVTVAPKGTVFIKVGSHRALDKMVRLYDIEYLELHSFYSNFHLYLIKEEDYSKIQDITGISKPVTKAKSNYRPTWSSKGLSKEQERLLDLFRKVNV